MTYRGHDAVDKCIDHLIKLEDKLLGVLRESKPMDLSEEETKHSRKQLNATSATKNWQKIPFVITVKWRENLEVQLIVTVI